MTPVRDVPKPATRETSLPLAGLRVLVLGHGDPDYSRNRIVVKTLRRAGAEPILAFDRRALPVRAPGFLYKAFSSKPDLLWVGFPGQMDVLPAKAAAKIAGIPLIFDAFLSTYERYVVDTGKDPRCLEARRRHWMDRISTRLADTVLLDTQAHIDYFSKTFGTAAAKTRRLWVGADDELVRPMPPAHAGTFTVLCYSSFLPLHGMEYVIRAARLLRDRGENVRFLIPGGGQTYAHTEALARTLDAGDIRFTGAWVPFAELTRQMDQSHVCLGIFGTTEKAARVIPNKVFDALASKRAVITADTPAAREALTHGTTAWLCPAGDPAALADAIVKLKNDSALREGLAENGYRLFREKFCLQALTADLSRLVLETLERSRA